MRLVVGGAFSQGVQLFARLEADGLSGGDAHLGTGAGISADAGFAGTHAEDAEPAQFNALTGSQSLFEPFEDCVHRSLSLGAGQPSALDHVMDDVLLNQSVYLAGAIGGADPGVESFPSFPVMPRRRL